MSNEVLVIDASEAQAAQVKTTLESLGLHVRTAADGQAGLRALQEAPPAVVIVEPHLPGLDGLEVCRSVKRSAATRHIRVILLAEDSGAQATLAGLQAGADDYIPKDIFATEHLVTSLQEMGLLE